MAEPTNGPLPEGLGKVLATLRKRAGKSQADIGRALDMDASRVSRFETGEVTPPSIGDVEAIARAIDSDEAREFLAFLNRPFTILARPEFNHPERETLEIAEGCLQRLDCFVSLADVPGPLVRQADMFRDLLLRSANYVSDLNHSVAYMGEIGAGKTTFVCMQTGLVLDRKTKFGLEQIVLEFGRGGITLCEVRITHGDRVGLIVEPCPDAEVYRLADELCAGIWEQSDPAGDGERQEKGVPREINRALRNMAGLQRRRTKDANGKVASFDSAKELAGKFSQLDDFRAEFSSRLRLWERKRRETWFEASSGESEPVWLRRTFAEINNGRDPEFPLPQRITIHAPSDVLRKHGYSLEMIDTKGVDRTAMRPDLQSCIDDTRTFTVLCSRFTQAPDVSLQGLIEHVRDSGSDRALQERMAMLVLAHDTEALGMKDDSGALVENEADGYELRREQVQAELTRIGSPEMPVLFFNAKTESPDEITCTLVERVASMRRAHTRRIEDVAGAVDQLFHNRQEQHALASQREVNKKLRIFAEQHQQLGMRKRSAHSAVVSAIRSLHPSTVWATTRRSGSWNGLDVYFYLGAGAEAEVKQRTEPALAGLLELIRNMLGDADLEPAHKFLRQLLASVEVWRDAFLDKVRRAGEYTYRPALEGADQIWCQCEGLYGRGLPYRNEVSNLLQSWFEEDDRDHLHMQLDDRIRELWEAEVLEPLANLSEEAFVGEEAA